MCELLKRIWQEDDAQDLAEYAMLLMLVSLSSVIVLYALMGTTDRMFFHAVHTLFKWHMIYE